MPVWAWIGFTLLTAYATFRLVRSLRTGASSFGPFQYQRENGPIFWLIVGMDGVFFVFVIALWVLVLRRQFFA
jgi:hypothetical protein